MNRDDKPFRTQDMTRNSARGLYLPELRVHVGRDGYGGGMTAYSWIATEELHAVRVALIEQRWQEGPQSTLECVEVAIKGLQWYLGEADGVSS